jgi:chromosome segregation ATPase
MSKRKELMAVLHAALRQLNEADEMDAEANAVKSVLEARQAEVAEVEARLARLKEEAAKADSAHNDWRQTAERERAAGDGRLGQMQAKLQSLEQRIAEREVHHSSIVAGIASLSQRLRIK